MAAKSERARVCIGAWARSPGAGTRRCLRLQSWCPVVLLWYAHAHCCRRQARRGEREVKRQGGVSGWHLTCDVDAMLTHTALPCRCGRRGEGGGHGAGAPPDARLRRPPHRRDWHLLLHGTGGASFVISPVHVDAPLLDMFSDIVLTATQNLGRKWYSWPPAYRSGHVPACLPAVARPNLIPSTSQVEAS